MSLAVASVVAPTMLPPLGLLRSGCPAGGPPQNDWEQPLLGWELFQAYVDVGVFDPGAVRQGVFQGKTQAAG